MLTDANYIYIIFKQVVYSLHTRNDENEECIEVLKAEHLKEKQELMQKCDTRVEELEAERNRSKALEVRLSELKTERTTLTGTFEQMFS